MTETFGEFFGWLAQTDLAAWLRRSRCGYAFVNGSHILGIALLVGAIVPMDLRLIGIGRRLPVDALARRLVPVAAAGLAIAVATGLMMASTQALDYLGLRVFQVKMALVLAGGLSAVLLHIRYGWWLKEAPPCALRSAGLFSLCCWLPALFAGRLIAFMGA